MILMNPVIPGCVLFLFQHRPSLPCYAITIAFRVIMLLLIAGIVNPIPCDRVVRDNPYARSVITGCYEVPSCMVCFLHYKPNSSEYTFFFHDLLFNYRLILKQLSLYVKIRIFVIRKKKIALRIVKSKPIFQGCKIDNMSGISRIRYRSATILRHMSDRKDLQEDLHVLSFFFFFATGSRKPLESLGNHMAIINSVVVGRGVKSVGEVSLQVRRGRTIASRRITENKSNTPAQSVRRSDFGAFVKLFSQFRYWFSENYEKTKYGSRFNNFVKVNKELIGNTAYGYQATEEYPATNIGLYKLLEDMKGETVPAPVAYSYGTLRGNVVPSQTVGVGNTVADITLMPDGLEDIKCKIQFMNGGGRYFVGSIDLYSGGKKYPESSYDDGHFGATSEISSKTDVNTGIVTIHIPADMAADKLLYEAKFQSEEAIEGYLAITISQNGKILTNQSLFVVQLTNPQG